MEAKRPLHHLSPREKIALARRLLLAQGDADGSPARLRAFVRWRNTTGHRSDAARAFLLERLPAHMVPAEIEPVDEWPRLPNGKVDRQALLRVERVQSAPRGHDAGPHVAHHPRIAALIEIWQSLLGREAVGVNDNFFALGGHSLLAMQMMSRIHQVLAVEVPMHAFFEAPTVAKLAATIELQLLLRPPAPRAGAGVILREDGMI